PRLVSTQAQRGPHCAVLALAKPGGYPAPTASRLARRNSLNKQMYFLEDASSKNDSNAVASAARQVLFQSKAVRLLLARKEVLLSPRDQPLGLRNATQFE